MTEPNQGKSETSLDAMPRSLDGQSLDATPGNAAGSSEHAIGEGERSGALPAAAESLFTHDDLDTPSVNADGLVAPSTEGSNHGNVLDTTVLGGDLGGEVGDAGLQGGNAIGCPRLATNGEPEFKKISLGFVEAESFAGWWTAVSVSTVSVIGFGTWIVLWLFGIVWLGTVFWVLLSIAAGVVLFFGLFPRYWALREYRHASWRFTEFGLEIRRGVWWRHRITLPRDRVQHTDVVQGPVMRRFGIAKLVIHTAGTHSPSVELPGLLLGDAESLRDQMTTLSN